MLCPFCNTQARKTGMYRNRQRWRCDPCGGKSWTEPEAEKVPEVPDDGVVTAEKMRKVLGQDPLSDCTPTERALREMMAKGMKAYLERIDELDGRVEKERKAESELARLRAKNAELVAENERLRGGAEKTVDEGSDRAMALIDRILAEAGA